MKIPLRYNLRSLWVRRVGTLMTALGIGLTVAIVITMMALVNGLDATFVETGHESQLIVLRKGSFTETNSYLNRDLFEIVRFLPGVARNSADEPLAAGEITVVINHPRLTGESSNVLVRGTSEMGFALRPEVEIVQGRKFQKGLRELVASRSLAERFRDMQLGKEIQIARSRWKIVGIFDAGGTAYDSELWGDYDEIAGDWDRPIYSSILLRAEDGESLQRIRERVEDDNRIQLEGIEQKRYFEQQTVTSLGIKGLGFFIALVMGIGSAFAAMNMMYGAVMSRSQEIATLRALGFRRRSVLASFLAESFVLSLLGGILGCLMALPLHGISTGTANWMTFSEVLFNFRITPGILLWGVLFAVMVGSLGGFLPAVRAARIRLIDVLRQ